jgi:anti-anti-sigma factor
VHPPPSKATERDVGLAFAHVRLARDAARLTLTGELDLATAARAAARIRHAQDESSVLNCDLRELWLLDLSGLRVLLDAAGYAERTGRRLLVANAPPILPRMLRVLGAEDALEAPSLPLRVAAGEACASFRPHVSRRPARRAGGNPNP